MSCNCKDVEVKIKLLYEDSEMPSKAHEDDAGYDLRVHSVWIFSKFDKKLVEAPEKENLEKWDDNCPEPPFWTIQHNQQYLVKTGFSMALPPGFEAQIRPRSGLALKHNISVSNSPGTIDAGYRNEVGVLLHSRYASNPLQIKVGDRIAQMVIKRVPQIRLIQVDDLDDSDRGMTGFGDSGVK